MEYAFTYGKIERKLPVFEVSGGLKIAYLDTFCDLELVEALSSGIAEKIRCGKEFAAAERVIILTAVSKGVPFAYTVANKLLSDCGGKKIEIAIARKQYKKFYGEIVSAEKTSITSLGQGDELFLAEIDVKKLRGASVIVLDDMYSTGASVKALEELARKCGATVIDRVVAVWETDDETVQPPVKYVATLPLIK